MSLQESTGSIPGKISIVLPTYNGMQYLPQAVENCLGQLAVDLELVIVDDGSQDGTSAYLGALTDNRIKVIRHPVNLGLPSALNTGFAQTTGGYLTWTSNDNLYTSDALMVMTNYLEEHQEVALVCAPYWEIDETDTVLRLTPLNPVEEIWEHNPVGACFLYRRSVYESIGEYDTDARLAEDYDYWLRIAKRFRIVRIATPLYYYRLHRSSLTSQPGVLFGRERLVARLKREKFGWSWWRYRVRMAGIDIEEAFACYRDGIYMRVPMLVFRGITRDPRWLRNLGVTSIALRSLIRMRLSNKGRV